MDQHQNSSENGNDLKISLEPTNKARTTSQCPEDEAICKLVLPSSSNVEIKLATSSVLFCFLSELITDYT
jgi:hypothetical protein